MLNYLGSSPLKGNKVILTGASKGIGKALALELAKEGAHLALAARDIDLLNKTAEQCSQYTSDVKCYTVDVSKKSDCQELVTKVVNDFGGIDTLINNAGISMWSLFEKLEDIDNFRHIMDVNYYGALYLTHAALPYLKKSEGRIVAVSSLAGKTGVPTRSLYSASKHAMNGFFDTLRIELLETGITVSIAYPDFVASEIRKQSFGADGKKLGHSPIAEDKIMTAERCAEILTKGIIKRQRDINVSLRGRVGKWIQVFSPKIIDKVAANAIKKAMR